MHGVYQGLSCFGDKGISSRKKAICYQGGGDPSGQMQGEDNGIQAVPGIGAMICGVCVKSCRMERGKTALRKRVTKKQNSPYLAEVLLNNLLLLFLPLLNDRICEQKIHVANAIS